MEREAAAKKAEEKAKKAELVAKQRDNRSKKRQNPASNLANKKRQQKIQHQLVHPSLPALHHRD